MLAAISTGELIIQVNDSRSFYDPFRLNDSLSDLITARTGTAKVMNSAVLMAAGDQAGARDRMVEAREKLVELERNGHSYLKGLPAQDVPVSEVNDALESYGWERGLIGDLVSPLRIEALAEQAASATPGLDPAVRYPAALLSRIANWLGILLANKAIAGGGTVSDVVNEKDAAREALLAAIGRVRYYYCSASDERDQTPELAKIGLQPRRDSGDAQPQPLPAAPGTATFNAATRELTIPDLPDHATSIKGWRQPAGGQPEVAGVSVGVTVSVSDFSPLVPGVSYTAWVTGHNSRGDGPAGNKITFTA